jgi:hypothetical protein
MVTFQYDSHLQLLASIKTKIQLKYNLKSNSLGALNWGFSNITKNTDLSPTLLV